MEGTWGVTLVLCVILIYFSLYFFSKHMEEISPTYNLLVQRCSIHVGCLNIRASTTFFNRTICKVGTKYSGFWNVWFGLGTASTVGIILPAVVLLMKMAVTGMMNLVREEKHEVLLQPVLPGVNLPTSDLFCYFLTLFTCTVVHEVGHALAAVGEKTPLVGIGVVLFVIVPAAFVELPSASVSSLSPWKQLRIYCAGIWHNVLLSLLAYVILLLLPVLGNLFFTTGTGVYLYSFNEYDSGGSHDFQVGDTLTAVDDCRVTNMLTWNVCLTRSVREPQLGFCLEKAFHSAQTPSTVSACCPDGEAYQSHLCFIASSQPRAQYCLKVRSVFEASSSRQCHAEQACATSFGDCLMPSFNNADRLNASDPTRLLAIERENRKAVLYVGEVGELYQRLHVSNYVPKTCLSPGVVVFVEKFLGYIISFSAGLAILNAMPCIAMDGQHISNALIEWAVGGRTNTSHRVSCTAVTFGTSLVVVNIIVGIYSLLN